MNSKKSKRIRQLVKHLQQRAAIEDNHWTEYADTGSNSPLKLNDKCGRAVYQAMKNNVKHGKTHD